MLISRLQLSDLAALGQSVDWPREATDNWPTARSPAEYLVIWHKDDANLPDTLVVPTSAEEFFAWSTTYLPNLTPLSSIVRVVERVRQPKQSVRADFDIRVLLGMCVAETAASYSKVDPEEISLSHCTSSLTYCLLQSIMLGSLPVGDDLASKWLEAISLLGLPQPRFHVPQLLDTWQQVTNALTGSLNHLHDSSSRNAQANFLATVLGSSSNGSSLRISLQYDDFLRSMSSGPLEDRVRRFKEIARDIRERREIDDNLAGIILGFGLSEISGGTFRHSHLIGPSLVRDVRSLLWYGCFEAAKGVAGGGGWLASGTGLRLRRELASLPHAVSDSDINLEELRVLARGTKGEFNFSTKHAGLARVLLEPGITVELAHDIRVQPRLEPAPREKQGRQEALPSLSTAESYRSTLLRFLQEGNRRIFFTTPMKFTVDQQAFGKVFDFQKAPGLAHAELVAVPSNGPLVVRMTTPSYNHRIQNRKRLVVTDPHELSIPVEYLDALPWRDSTHGHICLSLKATLKLNLGKWTIDRG